MKYPQSITRRDSLRRASNGIGMLAFSALAESIARAGSTAATGGLLRELHHQPRAKHVIFLFLNGGCSSIDSFDYKPELIKYDGKPLPGGETKTERKTGSLMKSPFEWKRYGANGKYISELWPNLAQKTDNLCFIHSMTTDITNHEPSILMMHTRHNQTGRPSIGSWVTYGLGTFNRNLPGYTLFEVFLLGPNTFAILFLSPAGSRAASHRPSSRQPR